MTSDEKIELCDLNEILFMLLSLTMADSQQPGGQPDDDITNTYNGVLYQYMKSGLIPKDSTYEIIKGSTPLQGEGSKVRDC